MSLKEAAITVLEHDGHEFELRADDVLGLRLFISRGSRNSMTGPGIFGPAYIGGQQIHGATEDEIWQTVITAGWPCVPDVMPDSEYDRQQTETIDECGG